MCSSTSATINHWPTFLCQRVARLLVASETNLTNGPVVAISSSANSPVATCAARIASKPNTENAPKGLWPTSWCSCARLAPRR